MLISYMSHGYFLSHETSNMHICSRNAFQAKMMRIIGPGGKRETLVPWSRAVENTGCEKHGA